MKNKSLSQLAKEFAIKAHSSTNHKYDGRPYKYHLNMVVKEVMEFIHLIPLEYREIVIAAAWLHDTIEDCRINYNDLKKIFGVQVAELAFALSNEKGRTRSERANDKYYQGILEVVFAPLKEHMLLLLKQQID